ncbi:single-stranded DNA-binding protein [Aeromicrobium sp. A1-2]|uniref:single-stranded DNA-binding protein n=1 Tax=Aeromicrobium sp. A1-2 TaxID=2107713 RepID=UPI000E53C4E6|nr:single-stranded DNA-binding protein [Aeromicrobium sp. A1-2]
MTIPTQMSLHGFIATAPELTYGKSDVARFRARVGIEQWHKEYDGAFAKLDPQFCDMVLFKPSAERAYARFRVGDQFVASGYVHEYEFDRDGTTIQHEEFVARRIGHDAARTRYDVDRPTPAVEREARLESGREPGRPVAPPAPVGL